MTFSRKSMATTVYLHVSTGTFQPPSLSRGHSFEVSKYDGKNEVYPDLIQGRKIKAKTVRHPPAKAGLKGVHRQDCRRQPPTIIALSRQDSYAHTLKGYFYTNLGGTQSNKSVSLMLNVLSFYLPSPSLAK